MSYEDPMIKVIEKRIEAIELIVSSMQKQINSLYNKNFTSKNP